MPKSKPPRRKARQAPIFAKTFRAAGEPVTLPATLRPVARLHPAIEWREIAGVLIGAVERFKGVVAVAHFQSVRDDARPLRAMRALASIADRTRVALAFYLPEGAEARALRAMRFQNPEPNPEDGHCYLLVRPPGGGKLSAEHVALCHAWERAHGESMGEHWRDVKATIAGEAEAAHPEYLGASARQFRRVALR